MKLHPYIPDLSYVHNTPLVFPAVSRLRLKNFGLWRKLDWKPSAGVNIIEASPGSGATTLCLALALATLPSQFRPRVPTDTFAEADAAKTNGRPDPNDYARNSPPKVFAMPATVGAESLKSAAASLMIVSPWQAIVFDKDIVGVMDAAKVEMFITSIQQHPGQLFVFLPPHAFRVFDRCRGEFWRITLSSSRLLSTMNKVNSRR